MVELGVNIDHVATLRQARKTYEPDPVEAAAEAEAGGADSITVHLREDRRHINDRDVHRLRETVRTKLNLEMSLTPEIIEIAVRVRPDQATIVPERRQEITTEGGIDLLAAAERSRHAVRKLKEAGIFVSAFIGPEERQIDAARQQGYDAVELHTGDYANAHGPAVAEEFERLRLAGVAVRDRGLRLHAGHGLNYRNVQMIAAIVDMAELNIGHAIVSRAVFVGLRQAVHEMKAILLAVLERKNDV